MGLLDNISEDQLIGGLLGAGAASGARGNFLSRLAAGMGAGEKFKTGRAQEARQRSQDELQAEYKQLMMKKMQMDAEREQRAAVQEQTNTGALRSALSPMSGIDALAGGGGPTPENAARIGQPQPFDVRQFIAKNPGVDLQGIQQYMAMDKAMNPAPETKVLKPGDIIGTMGKGGVFNQTYAAPEKATPIDYNKPFLPDGTPNTAYQKYSLTKAKTGAAQIGMPKIDIKMGDSVAGQIGPMAKDSRTQAQGAVKMFDAADRIDAALESGMVSAGPGTTQIQTVKQLIQKISGGNDEGIRQTRQVIKSLAQMAVEARKQLAGQGQVTESEAAAVAKADAGDINDLTTGELQDLVTLTRRAAHYSAKGHQEIIDAMSANDGTKSGVPFYKVQGMDRLLQYKPVLPQIGGAPSNVDSLVNKYRSK